MGEIYAAGFTPVTQFTRRRFLQLIGASVTSVLLQAFPRRAAAATWRLHGDTDQVGLRKLYSGSDNNPGCDTGEQADCRGPRRMSCYWGALYVNSVRYHRLRTGPFTGRCNATWPGTGNTARVRWASHHAASVWQPEYRFVGKLYVNDIMDRPNPWSGLVLHPVHINNCNNYWIRLWERDNPSHVVWGREVNDNERWILDTTLPHPRSGGGGTITRSPCSRAAASSFIGTGSSSSTTRIPSTPSARGRSGCAWMASTPSWPRPESTSRSAAPPTQ